MGSVNDVLVINMAKAVHYHLAYINSVARTDVVAESCFRLPATEYIERHPNLGFSIFLEHLHPVFKYRRIDLAWARGNDKAPTSFMEMKYVKSGTADTIEIQRFYNDLERLASILAASRDVKCYFLASGLSINWEECFKNKYIPDETKTATESAKKGKKKPNLLKVASEYNSWFSFDREKPVKIIKLKEDHSWHKEFLKQYEKRKEAPDFSLRRFTTRLLWISGTNTKALNENTVTGIWEIGR